MDENRTPEQIKFLADFGNRVRQVRKATGMTQEDVAAEAGIARSYYGEIETGKRNASLLNIYKIAKSLGVSVSTLFEFTPSDAE